MSNDPRKPHELEKLLFDEDAPEDAARAEAPGLLRDERALVSLDVAFSTPRQVVEAYSEAVGVGQIALQTNDTLRKGTELTVRMRVPGWAAPIQACGRVTWSRADAMGIAFTQLSADEKQRLEQLVQENTTLMERVKRQLSRQVERPVPAHVRAQRTTLLQLQDEMLSDVVAELLGQSG
jgi:hypothetical protein